MSEQALPRVEGPRPVAASGPARDEYRAAVRAYERGDRAAAEEGLRRLRRDHPGLAEVGRELGVVLAERGRFDEALPLVRQALAADARDADAMLAHAHCLAGTGKLDEAASMYRVFLQRHARAAARTRRYVEKQLESLEAGVTPGAAEAGTGPGATGRVPGQAVTLVDEGLPGEGWVERRRKRRIRNRVIFWGLFLGALTQAPKVWSFFTEDPEVIEFVNRWAGVPTFRARDPEGPGLRKVLLPLEFLVWTREALSTAKDARTQRALQSLPLFSAGAADGEPASMGAALPGEAEFDAEAGDVPEPAPSGSPWLSTVRLDFFLSRLIREGTRPAVLALRSLLDHEDEGVAARAVTGLAHVGSVEARQELERFVEGASKLDDGLRYSLARDALEGMRTAPAGALAGGNSANAERLLRYAQQAMGASF